MPLFHYTYGYISNFFAIYLKHIINLSESKKESSSNIFLITMNKNYGI